MADINAILASLNANYTQITDLVPDNYVFVDDMRFGQDEYDGIYNSPPLGQNLLRLSSGKLIWVGASGTDDNVKNVRRFNSDYTLDETFVGPSFQNGNSGMVRAAAEQSDGKLIVVGNFTEANSDPYGHILRLDTNGDIDPTFNFEGAGFVGQAVWAVEVLSDDSIVVAGNFSNYNDFSVNDFCKLGPDGLYMGPRNITNIAQSADGASAITASDHGLSNGDVIIISDSDSDVSVNGTWTVSVSTSDIFTIPEAGVTVAGSTGILILNDGLDANSVPQFDGNVMCFEIDAADKIYVGGDFFTNLVRLNSDGTFDQTFNIGAGFNYLANGPTDITNISLSADGVCEITAPNHKILSGEQINIYNSNSSPPIDGEWTATVVNDNVLSIPEAGVTVVGSSGYLGLTNSRDVRVSSLAIDSDGNLIVGGWFDSYKGEPCNSGIIRLNTSVGPIQTITSIATSVETTSLITCTNHGLSTNDSIYISGSDSDLTIDAIWDVSVVNADTFTILEPGITVAGTTGTFVKVAGQLDLTFETEGSGIENDNYVESTVQSVAVQPDGKVLVGGWFNLYDGSRQGHILRLNSNGTKDTTFDTDFGFNDVHPDWGDGNDNGRVNKILVNGDGSILCTGHISAYNFSPINGFAKLSSTGTLSTTQILKYKFISGISDGQNDMYDGGNFLNTDLTQVFEDISESQIFSTEKQLACIPITHSVGTDDDSFRNASDQTIYYPPMDGAVKSGDNYFGEGSSYFTNYYPGLFVLVATNISIDEFSVTGDVGSDEDTVNASFIDLHVNGKTYSAFVKTNIEDGGNDPSVNQIIIVPGESAGITQTINEDGDDYDDHLIRGLTGRTELYYLLTARDNALPLSEEDAFAVVEKFLTLIEFGDPDITVEVEISPVLRNLGTEGSLDVFDENGHSVQRTFHDILIRKNGQYKIVGKIKDGDSFNNDVKSVLDYLSVKQN